MPLHLPPGFTDVTLIWSLEGDPERMTSNIAFGWNDDLAAPNVVDALTDAFADWMAQWGGNYTFHGADYRSNIAGTIFDGTSPQAANSGAPSAQVLIQNSALLLKKRTGLAGRANRGRMYIPPGRLAEVDISDTGVIPSSALATINTEIDAIFDAGSAVAGWDDYVVLHSETAPGVGPAPTPLVQIVADGIVATQRRRLRH